MSRKKTKKRVVTDESKAIRELLPIWRVVYNVAGEIDNIKKELSLLKELLEKVGN